MLGLEGYGSSDEEIEKSNGVNEVAQRRSDVKDRSGATIPDDHATAPSASLGNADASAKVSDRNNDIDHTVMARPALGPAAYGPTSDLKGSEDGADSAPASPYTRDRRLVHELTLPPIPNVFIPPSPPGSPPASTTTKFEHFLSLKEKGVHFNARLGSSITTRNPALLSNLLEFAAIDEEVGQYANSLPPDLAVGPAEGWDETEYAEALVEEVKRRETSRKEGRTGTVGFVSGGQETAGRPIAKSGRASNKRDAPHARNP